MYKVVILMLNNVYYVSKWMNITACMSDAK